jgi:hypothetical protein
MQQHQAAKAPHQRDKAPCRVPRPVAVKRISLLPVPQPPPKRVAKNCKIFPGAHLQELGPLRTGEKPGVDAVDVLVALARPHDDIPAGRSARDADAVLGPVPCSYSRQHGIQGGDAVRSVADPSRPTQGVTSGAVGLKAPRKHAEIVLLSNTVPDDHEAIGRAGDRSGILIAVAIQRHQDRVVERGRSTAVTGDAAGIDAADLPLGPAGRAVGRGCRALCLNVRFQITPSALPTLANAVTAFSRSSREWAADICVRMRAWPCGTTG